MNDSINNKKNMTNFIKKIYISRIKHTSIEINNQQSNILINKNQKGL